MIMKILLENEHHFAYYTNGINELYYCVDSKMKFFMKWNTKVKIGLNNVKQLQWDSQTTDSGTEDLYFTPFKSQFVFPKEMKEITECRYNWMSETAISISFRMRRKIKFISFILSEKFPETCCMQQIYLGIKLLLCEQI